MEKSSIATAYTMIVIFSFMDICSSTKSYKKFKNLNIPVWKLILQN